MVETEPLLVELEGEIGPARPAWADPALIGECRTGDQVVVNTEALDLGLGSGGFDIVHVNLTRGLSAPGSETDHVMKLNYSPLQHPVGTVERPAGVRAHGEPDRATRKIPVLAIGLHGHLAPAAWAAAQTEAETSATPGTDRASSVAAARAPETRQGRGGDGIRVGDGLRVGYVQTGGGALPGTLSRDVKTLIRRGLLAGHVTAGPAYGGEAEAITLVGALDAASSLGWDAVIAGPGPGILGSETAYGHGGMAALDVLHGALALGYPALLSPRLSAADPRPRHTGLSHHSRAVLELCLGPVEVPLPEQAGELPGDRTPDGGLDRLIAKAGERGHRPVRQPADLDGYRDSGLPRRSMGRDLDDDPVFFAAPLAAGSRLAAVAAG